MSYCNHTRDESWWEYDAQGIELARVCDDCRSEKLAKYRPEILRGYDQSDVDEPIEPEEAIPVNHASRDGRPRYRHAGYLSHRSD